MTDQYLSHLSHLLRSVFWPAWNAYLGRWVVAAFVVAFLCHCSSGELGVQNGSDSGTADGATVMDGGAPMVGEPFDPGSPCSCNYAFGSTTVLSCSCPASCFSDGSCPIHCAGSQCVSNNSLLDRCGSMQCDPQEGSDGELNCRFSECPDPAVTCEGEVELLEDQVQVIMPRRTVDTGTLRVSERGWYDISNSVLAESGASQMNETAYFRVPQAGSDDNPEGYPRRGNCGRDWIVIDSDNEGTPDEPKFVGTFWLEEGDNELVMYHYCPDFLDGNTCEEFHIESNPASLCGSGVQSVHFKAEGTQAVCVDPGPPLI